MSSTVGQMLPNRPLPEEHDEEVAVHELQAGQRFPSCDENVCCTWPSTMD